ncbi:MAG: dihydroorotase [Desulfobacterales bacterium]|nr:dihydroorotase [Desulfobacterales bacterium]
MKRILVTDARIVNEGKIQNSDVLVANGRIEAIGGDLSRRDADIRIEAAGRVLLPGMIDDQVHFREPGLTRKGDISSESRAAVAGGITSFMEMPNTVPATTTGERLAEKFAVAAKSAFANYSFYLGGANDNIEEIERVDSASVCGVKVFMGSSTGNLLVDDPAALEAIFSRSPVLVATHCEDDGIIAKNAAAFRERYGEAVPMRCHSRIRSAQACFASSSLAVDLARKHGTRLHVLHLTTAREMELFSPGPVEGKQITAEVCVHHLFFCDADYERLGARIKCNPAIKTAADRDALIDAVADGRIDVIATDHAPHTLGEKDVLYFQSPSGLPLVQHALVSLLEHVHQGRFSLELIAERTAHAPARLFGIRDRGFIREGYWADLVLVDPDRPWQVELEGILYKCGWSPFEGQTFRSSVDATIVSGHLAYFQGKVDPAPAGKRLEFDR